MGTRPRRLGEAGSRVRIAVGLVLAGGFAVFGYLVVAPSSDTLLSLAWGNVLAGGARPDLSTPVLLPVPHPLPIVAAAPLSLLGPGGAYAALGVICGLSILLLAYAVVRLTRVLAAGRASGPLVLAASVLAAALLLTRPRVEYFLLTGVVDVPFTALVLLAIAQIAERPDRDPWVPLLLLAAAGLLRPEAWALAILYTAWLAARGLRGRPLAAASALVAAPPLLWALFNLVIIDDILHPLHTGRGLGVTLGAVGFSESSPLLDFGARWLPSREPIDNALLDVPGFAGSALTLLGLVGVAWGLWLWRRPRSRNGELPPAPAIVAAAVAALSVTLAGQSLFGIELADRYSLPLAAAAICFATALLVWIPWRPAAVVLAMGALVVAVWAENPSQDSKYRYYLRWTSKVRSDQREVAALADDPAAKAAIERCPRVIVGGRDRRKVFEARPIVALHLDRDLSRVEVTRTPHGQRQTSTFRLGLPSGPPPYLERDQWVFRSACLFGRDSGSEASASAGERGRR